MAIIFGKIHATEKYKDLVEPTLYSNSFLVPGVTYTDQYTEKAGGIYVPKIVDGGRKDPSAPGRDFAHEEAEDELIAILLNNEYSFSKKIYNVQAEAVSYDVAAANLKNNLERTRESVQASSLACMFTEGNKSANTAVASADTVKEIILSDRENISNKNGTANVMLCSPNFYTKVVLAAGKEFTPETNERIVTTGQVGRWLGMTFFEVNDFARGAAKYRNYANQEVTVNASDMKSIDYIMYDARVFSYLQLINMMRLKDSENFYGVLAQSQMDAGFRVTTPDCMIVKTHA